jgi:ferredoxin like protein
MNRLTIEEKLALNKYEVDEGQPHILIDQEICNNCSEKYCLSVCPACLFSELNGKIQVEWAGCLECGTCKAVCDKGALDWKYPNGTYGIVYRHG